MNLKPKPDPTSPPKTIQILSRTTDQQGRTLYQVKWVHDNNRISWEPLSNIKEFYKIVQEYERNYVEQVINWQMQARKGTSNASASVSGSTVDWREKERERERVKKAEDIQKREKVIDQAKEAVVVDLDAIAVESEVKQDGHLIKNTMVISARNQEVETINKQTLQQSSTKNALSIDPTPPIISLQPQLQPQPLPQPQPLLDPQPHPYNLSLLVYPKPPVPKTQKKVHRTYLPPRQHELQFEEEKIVGIKQIFAINRVWLATVLIEGAGEKIVLRDLLRILEPDLLVAYYEGLVEQRRRDFL